MANALDDTICKCLLQGTGPYILSNYIHPALQLEVSDSYGRHLVATRPIESGTLLLCEKAFAVSTRANLCAALSAELLTCENITRSCVLGLFDGKNGQSPVPGELFPRTASDRVASNRSHDDKSDDPSRLEAIVRLNCHNLSPLPGTEIRVSTTGDADEVFAWNQASGLAGVWLRAAFLTHSCSPNVHRMTLGPWMIIRAACDLEPEDVLLDAYINILQPASARVDVLRENYYFECKCHRCLVEGSLVPNGVFSRVARTLGEHPKLEDHKRAAAEAECAVGEVVRSFASGRGASLDTTGLDMRLLGAFAPVIEAAAIACEDAGLLSEAFEGYSKFESIISALLPNSNLHATVANAMCRCLWRAGQWQTPGGLDALNNTIAIHNSAYGGGFSSWRRIVACNRELPLELLAFASDTTTALAHTRKGNPSWILSVKDLRAQERVVLIEVDSQQVQRADVDMVTSGWCVRISKVDDEHIFLEIPLASPPTKAKWTKRGLELRCA
eukprot:TRINITY_DN26945_c0_g2_i1.p1 TRINITY_DN26945_c0_g2~~TRINITY_DN26945_c0_g2_i1.p1  ORF type:complete len:500 (-),score=46.69 TRINITY_DN26945_c0_g2_i1:362-1861(-)